MKAYRCIIFVAVAFPLLCLCQPEYLSSLTVEIEVPPIITENSTSPISCYASDETSSVTDYKVIWFDIGHNEELADTILDWSSSGISAISDDKIWTRYDNGKVIECCLHYTVESLDYQKCTNRQTLNVQFPPSNIHLEEVQINNTEDDTHDLTLKCRTDASNPRTKLTWSGLTSTMATKLKSIRIYDNTTRSFAVTEMMFMNLSRQDIGLTIHCQAAYSGWPEIDLLASYTINVTLSPKVKIIGDPVQAAQTGSDVSFRCLVDSYPRSHIAWYNETGILIESDASDYLDLVLHDVTLDANGSVFTCTGQNDVGNGINQSVVLLVQDIQVVAKEDHFLSFLGIGPVISIVIISANVAVVIIVIIIFVKCRKNHRTKQIPHENQDVNAGHHEAGIEESNTVTIEDDVVVYARVNKPPAVPAAGPGPSDVPVAVLRCDNVPPETLPMRDDAPAIVPRREYVHDIDSESGNVTEAVPGCANMAFEEQEQEHGSIPETGPEFDNVPTILPIIDADIEDDPQHRESFEVSERHYENVDNDELGSLAERNMIPPPYDTAEADDIDEEDNKQEPCAQTKQPRTLIYADVEFPGCSRETSTIIGDDPTVYSSVVFENIQVHSVDKSHDE